MTKKKMTFLAVTAVVVIGISGGAVYAYNYQQEQTRQEQEKIEQGKKEVAEKAERIRVEEARAEIEKQLDTIEQNMIALYANEDMKMPADGLTKDKIDAVQKELDAFKETYGADPNASKEQAARFESLEKEFQYIQAMFEIVGTYGSLYPEGQLAVPGVDANHLLTKMKTSLEALKTSKQDFYSQYMGKVDEAQNALAGQLAVREAVFMIYDKETGAMVDGVTRERYRDVLEAVNSLPENTLKAELLGYLPTVDQTLTAQEEAAQKATRESLQRKQASGNSTSSDTSGSSGRASSGYTESDVYSGSENSESGGSGSYSNGENNSYNNESSSGGDSSGGQTGSDNSTGGEEEYGRWEGTITGSGDIKGGGTWESFTW
ncbi:hypothetical protein [Enterocloster bolteae]|uniref:hypothetical protein n=1 Tax=Enterocloster bolteae TaxID=208479 RepID=UPI003AB75606